MRGMLLFLSGGIGDQLTRLAQSLYVHDRHCGSNRIIPIYLLTSSFNASLPSQSENVSSLVLPPSVSSRRPNRSVRDSRGRLRIGLAIRTLRWGMARWARFLKHRSRLRGSTPPGMLASCLFFGGWPDRDSFRREDLQSLGFPDRIIPKNPSRKFLELFTFVQKKKVMGVHLRLQDFADYQFVPDPSFYKKAIAKLQATDSFDSVWLFSDDAGLAQSLLGVAYFDFCPSSSGELSAVEELALLTECAGLVLSQSSFSWWAKFMNNKMAPAIAP